MKTDELIILKDLARRLSAMRFMFTDTNGERIAGANFDKVIDLVHNQWWFVCNRKDN